MNGITHPALAYRFAAKVGDDSPFVNQFFRLQLRRHNKSGFLVRRRNNPADLSFLQRSCNCPQSPAYLCCAGAGVPEFAPKNVPRVKNV